MTGRNPKDSPPSDSRKEDDIAAARWAMAIDEGLEPHEEGEFHAWLAERPERAELIARQAELSTMARQSRRQLAQAGEQALKSRRRVLFGGALATGAIALAGAAVMVRAPWLDINETYQTATGEVRTIDLADTSRLWLDARTQVAVHMTRERRDIQLTSGRLFIQVAHDTERPLYVSGANFEARAVGTAFEATVFDGRTGVTVTEGVVRLTARTGAAAIDLRAGEGAWIASTGELTRTSAPVPSIAAWRERRMVLSDRRLDTALAELSRYFDRPLTVADAQLAQRRVTLSFSIADIGEEDAARIIAAAVDAEVLANATGEIVLRPVPPETRSGAETNPR